MAIKWYVFYYIPIDQTMLFHIKSKVDLDRNPGEICSIHWHNGKVTDSSIPTLAIVYKSGDIFLLKNESDSSYVAFECGMKATSAKWSPDGQMLAVTGQQSVRDVEKDRDRDVNILQFYTNTGLYIRSIKLPGKWFLHVLGKQPVFDLL